MNKHTQAHIYLTVAGILFGANYWISKFTMPPFRPEQVVFFRIATATAFFWLLTAYKGFSFPPLRHIFVMALSGIFGVALNQYFFFRGIELSSAFETSLLHLLSPIFVALLASLFLSEALTMRKLTGIILGFAGAALVATSGKTISLENINFLGNLFILLNVTSYSIFLIMTRKMMQSYHPLMVITIAFTGGAVLYIPFAMLQPELFSFENIRFTDIAALTYVVVGSTIITYLLTMTALKYLEASTTSYYIFLQPFIAGIIGYLGGFEQFHLQILLALMLLIGGGLLVLVKPSGHFFLTRWGLRSIKSAHVEDSSETPK